MLVITILKTRKPHHIPSSIENVPKGNINLYFVVEFMTCGKVQFKTQVVTHSVPFNTVLIENE